MTKKAGAASAILVGLLAMACEQPQNQRSAETAPEGVPGTPLLIDIMQDLATDMAEAAGGIWTGDSETVAVAAKRIADHPNVSPAQRARIQAVLGADFGRFVSYDQGVHAAAVELGTAAAEGTEGSTLLESLSRIQEGCAGCHDTFRTRVQAALADSPENQP